MSNTRHKRVWDEGVKKCKTHVAKLEALCHEFLGHTRLDHKPRFPKPAIKACVHVCLRACVCCVCVVCVCVCACVRVCVCGWL